MYAARIPNINNARAKLSIMRIFGVNIPDNKRIEISLTYLYGVGPAVAKKALAAAKIEVSKKAKDLTADEVLRVQNYLEKTYPVEGELRQLIKRNIGRLKDLGTYRGNRHARRFRLAASAPAPIPAPFVAMSVRRRAAESEKLI